MMNEILSSDRSYIVQPPILFIGCTTWWWPVRGWNM